MGANEWKRLWLWAVSHLRLSVRQLPGPRRPNNATERQARLSLPPKYCYSRAPSPCQSSLDPYNCILTRAARADDIVLEDLAAGGERPVNQADPRSAASAHATRCGSLYWCQIIPIRRAVISAGAHICEYSIYMEHSTSVSAERPHAGASLSS